jgi:anti-sigma factor RsiW
VNGHLGDRAAAYVDGALGPDETARATTHLAACASCRAKVAEQQRVRDVLRGSSLDGATPAARADLFAALASMPSVGPPVRSSLAVSTGPSRRDALRWGAVSGVASVRRSS